MNDVTLIAINRPESRNAVNRQTAEQLKQAFLNFDKDKYAHVAVLYGKGTESRGGSQTFKVRGDKGRGAHQEGLTGTQNGGAP